MTLLWATSAAQVAGAGTGLGAVRGRRRVPPGRVFSGGELILVVFVSLVVVCFNRWIIVCSVYTYFEKIVQEECWGRQWKLLGKK